MYHPTDGSWYRKWSDGWLEQGGVATPKTSYTFIKPFSRTPLIIPSWYDVGGARGVDIIAKSATAFTPRESDNGGYTKADSVSFYACGQSA